MRVAVTGAGGRLGRALVAALADAPFTGLAGPLAWPRASFDLDAPDGIGPLLDREGPEVVIHAAAWTDVDACAREPELAMLRNGTATGVLARACASRGIDLISISTNEVFDGQRTDGLGYAATDEPAPVNPYGASKLAGETAAREAFDPGGSGRLVVARTAWLFGPGAPDFPAKILAAADHAVEAREPLRVVGDEWGCPTYVADVADALVELVAADVPGGIHHVVNGHFATRADWARYVVARAGVPVDVIDVPASTWTRASTPPRWGVLEPTPLPSGVPLRPWPDAMADYAPILLRERPAVRPAARPGAR
jgi:dTDP-4-dehydrorhamnose reductase